MEYGLVALWWLAFQALAFAGVYVAALVFPRRGDRGAALAVPLALAVVWVPAYWVGHVSFGWPAVVAGVGTLAVAAAVGVRRAGPVDWAAHAEATAVFTAAFLFLVAVRAADPAVHPIAGEKFLDFGLLKSMLRPGALPPEDVWFAGEPVQYYYGGHMLAAVLTRLTGTAPRYAYNLALSGYFATLVTAAYAVAGELADAAGGGRRVGGLFGAFFVGFAANLFTPLRLAGNALPAGLKSTVAGALSLPPDAFLSPREFHYWDASRVIPGTINEFPLFAFLNGDLHAHMMSTPFLLLAAALLAAYFRTPADRRWRRRALAFGAVPPLAGLLAVVNTWSFPTAVGLAWLTLALSPASPVSLLPERAAARLRTAGAGDRLRREAVRLGTATVLAAAVGVLGVLWAAPFFLGPASGRALALFPGRPSRLGELLVVHGGFLAVFGAYLAARSGTASTSRREVLGLSAVGVGFAAAAVLLAARLVAHAGPVGLAGVVLFAPLVAAAWLLLRLDGDVGYEAVLLAAGAGLALAVEVAYVREQAGPGRLNTVFKTYMQVWVLWGPAAGAALAGLVGGPDRPLVVPVPAGVADGGRPTVRRSALAVGLAAVVLAATATYGGLAAADHLDRRGDRTLDALRFVETDHPDEAAAIAWLDDRPGRPTIVTSPADGCRAYYWRGRDCNRDGRVDSYSGASAPASLTGLPTVAGWSHEVGYRGAAAYHRRVAEVREIYVGPPERQAELLAKYDVEYVYVGPAERFRYGEVDFSGVPAVGEPMRFGEVVIYPVEIGGENGE